MKELRAEKASLLAKRTEQYQTYAYFKDYHKELQTVCSNVDMILHQPTTRETERNKSPELS